MVSLTTFIKKIPLTAALVGAYIGFAVFLFCLPDPLFDVSPSTLLLDRNRDLLDARIAPDQQWRFPGLDTVPDKFVKSIVCYEDKRFFVHPGVDPLSVGRAIIQNLRHRRIVSGASTITMQVIRLSRNAKNRSLWEKIIEAFLAIRLELKYSKQTILAHFATHAPFGGNVVGLEAASWRYFGKPPSHLTWAEAATLAVLPNQPGLIHPGKNRDLLLLKRNKLLNRLYRKGELDDEELRHALEEPLPSAPKNYSHFAPHLLDYAKQKKLQGRIYTSIDLALQAKAQDVLERHVRTLGSEGIHNAAALIIDVQQNEVLAYVGNATDDRENGSYYVDIVQARRSSGSLLKPFLYGLMLEDGKITPDALVSDIPIRLKGFQPENFNNQFDGMVGASRALSRSLNVPFVKMLQQYGTQRFIDKLQQIGLTTIDRPADHYGLSLILGGAECTLWDVTNAYAALARILLSTEPNYAECLRQAVVFRDWARQGESSKNYRKFIGKGAVWQVFKALEKLERPSELGEWQLFSTERRIAWKTGTSFGFRDAWAVGVTPRYAVGVWVGNADGEGRPGLVGVRVAAPILFDLFRQLPADRHWFAPPNDELTRMELCTKSGLPASKYCPDKTGQLVPQTCKAVLPCPYHRLYFVTPNERFRADKTCLVGTLLEPKVFFQIPPVEAYYYQRRDPLFKAIPPLHPACVGSVQHDQSPLAIVSPLDAEVIFTPIDLGGNLKPLIVRAHHSQPETLVHWHLDNNYVGTTKGLHTISISPQAGFHRLVVVDEQGNTAACTFTIRQK